VTLRVCRVGTAGLDVPNAADPRIQVLANAVAVSGPAIALAVTCTFRPPVLPVLTVIERADVQLVKPHDSDQADSPNVTSETFAASVTLAVEWGAAVAVTVMV
jgi:hypothetical protein